MALGKLANCSRCDALFVMTVRDVCPKCHQEIEADYEKCVRFLRKRENRGANIHQLSEATGVSIRVITRFIREGRLSVRENPNLNYPCDNCGKPIQSGTVCIDCAKGLQREWQQQQEVDERLANEDRSRGVGYQRKLGEENEQ